MKFEKGEQVQLNGVWQKHCFAPSKAYPAGRRAVVVGASRTKGCIRIIFDDQKTVQTFHDSFLTKVDA
jgi:hypothetical protein